MTNAVPTPGGLLAPGRRAASGASQPASEELAQNDQPVHEKSGQQSNMESWHCHLAAMRWECTARVAMMKQQHITSWQGKNTPWLLHRTSKGGDSRRTAGLVPASVWQYGKCPVLPAFC